MPSGSEKEPAGKFRRITLSLSFTSLLTLVFLVIVSMGAAYIWGVMTGRAQYSSPPAQIVESKEREIEPEQGDSRILQAHELQFTQVLRGESTAPKPAPAQPIPDRNAPAVASEKSVPEAAPAKPPAPVGKPEKPTQAQGTPAPEVWDYVYQVAALKDEQAVDGLRQQLEGHGLRTRMERSGKVYLVMVLIRGDEDRASELSRITELLRLGEPLLRSRKAVTP